MSEMNPTASTNDSNEAAVATKEEREEHLDEPDAKKPKLASTEQKETIVEKLEQRLGGILCCTVCLDLPKSAIYQVGALVFSKSHASEPADEVNFLL